jgi:hypothetical protein
MLPLLALLSLDRFAGKVRAPLPLPSLTDCFLANNDARDGYVTRREGLLLVSSDDARFATVSAKSDALVVVAFIVTPYHDWG